MRKTTTILSVFAVLVLVTALVPAMAQHKSAKGKVVTVTGEVIDTACYFAGGKHGESHRKCAAMCINGGIPAGLLAEDGTIYILNEDHSDEARVKAYEQVKEHAADKITVTGTLVEKSGIKMLFVHEVKAS